MADQHLSVLADLLGVSDPDQFRSALLALISSLASGAVAPCISRLDTFQSEILQSQQSLSSRVDTAVEGIRELRSELQSIEASRNRESKQLLRKRSSAMESEGRAEKFVKELEFLQTSVVHLTSELSTKASANEVNRLNERMGLFCPTLYVQRIEAAVRTKCEEIDVRKLEKDVADLQLRLHESVAKGEVESMIRKLQDTSDRSIKGCISTAFFTRTIDRIENSIAIARKYTDDTSRLANERISEVSRACAKVAETLQAKAGQEQLSALESRCTEFATVVMLEKGNEAIQRAVGLVEDMRALVDTTLQMQDDALRRYDEILLDKANKLDLVHIETRLRRVEKLRKVKARVSEVEHDLGTLLGQQSEHQHSLEDLDKRLSDAVANFSAFKSERKDLQALLVTLRSFSDRFDSKADQSDLLSLADSKANKIEVQSVIRSLGMMYRIDKLGITLINHAVKCICELAGEGVPATALAAEWLAKHAEMVAAWANSYEPIENEVDFPPDITSILTAKSAKTLHSRPSLSPLNFTPRRISPIPSPLPSTSAHSIYKRLQARRNESVKRHAELEMV